VAILAFLIIGGFGVAADARASHMVDGNELVYRYENWERVNQPTAPSTEDERDKVFGKAMQFVGYVQGVVDSVGRALCLPTNAKGGQLFAIVGSYLKSHPAEWKESGAKIIFRALNEAFPCPEK
jgi:hypothetical protein